MPLMAALIGGAAAIVGGVLAARYQAQQTRNLALQLRACEREEEAVLRLAEIASEIRSRMDAFLWDFKNNPNTTNTTQPAAEAAEAQGKLVNTFRDDLSWRIRDEWIRNATVDLINALGYFAGGGTTNQDELQRAVEAANVTAKGDQERP